MRHNMNKIIQKCCLIYTLKNYITSQLKFVKIFHNEKYVYIHQILNEENLEAAFYTYAKLEDRNLRVRAVCKSSHTRVNPFSGKVNDFSRGKLIKHEGPFRRK